jgi:hypothetical protein
VSEEKIGIEGIEKCIDLGVKNAILGIEIADDGINLDDIKHGPALFNNIKELVEFVASKPELAKEFADIDPAEGFALLQKSWASYQAIKEAAAELKQ